MELAALDLDVVALQEIDCRWGERSDNADVAKEMAELLGCHFFFCPSINQGGRQYGNALLSRYPIVESGRVELSPQVKWDRSNHETEPRTAAWIRIELPQPTVVVTTHLANAIGFASTMVTGLQADRLTSLIADLGRIFPQHLRILCGDFNLTPDSPEIALLASVLPRRSGDIPTWPVQPFEYKGWAEDPPPRFSVDHFFANSPLEVDLIDSKLSDHLPLVAEVATK